MPLTGVRLVTLTSEPIPQAMTTLLQLKKMGGMED
jgi:hypothetical protein